MKKLIVLLCLLAVPVWAGDYDAVDKAVLDTRWWEQEKLNDNLYRGSNWKADEIKRLAASGEICAVLGHCWRYMPIVTLLNDPNPPERRCCSICNRCEERRMGDWK